MQKTVIFDITHLVSRWSSYPHTGIDRVDVAYSEAMANQSAFTLLGLHCGISQPHLLSASDVGKIAAAVRTHGAGPSRIEDDPTFSTVTSWINRTETPQQAAPLPPSNSYRATWNWKAPLARLQWMLRHDPHLAIAPGSIYLNVAPYGVPNSSCFNWLRRRPDVKPVFFIHDLLLLDHPEFFPASWQKSYSQMIDKVMHLAAGIIVASEVVQARVARELRARGCKDIPLLAAPLPSPLCHTAPLPRDAGALSPYFVACGTIEPRKNHLLLLNVWRDLICNTDVAPKLIVVGKKGWENDQVRAVLDGCPSISDFVLQTSATSDVFQQWLLLNSCGALIPSFAEGYGFPLVEALSLGVPTIASNIPVFREASQGHAIFCDPLNAQEWQNAIQGLSSRSSSRWQEEAARTLMFRPPTWSNYFKSIFEFLEKME